MMVTKRPIHAFLCHSSGDKLAVKQLYDRLVKDGVDAWLDKEKLIPGQEWQVEIPKAVKNSDVVIVCLSSQSVTKEGFVQKEIKFALDIADEKPEGTIFIIPARLEDCDIPKRISRFHWVDLYSEDGYEHLMKALQLRANNLELSITSPQEVTLSGDKASPPQEITLFRTKAVRRFTWSSHRNCYLTLTNMRLIFRDLENDFYSFELPINDLHSSWLNTEYTTDLVINTIDGKEYNIGLRKGVLPQLMKAIQDSKSFKNA